MASSSEDKILDIGVKVAGALAVYFIVVEPLLNTLGQSPEEKAAIDSIDHTLPNNNPFSFQYSVLQTKWNQWGMNRPIGDYMVNIKQIFDDGNIPPDMNFPSASIDGSVVLAGELIKNNFGWWRFHITGNVNDVLAVFNAVNRKWQVAAIAAYLWYNYNIDLWTYLKEGDALMWRGLSSADLKMIVDRVNSLPM